MKPNNTSNNSLYTNISLSVPNEIIEDIIKIASFNNTKLDVQIYSYIIDGIANDSRIIKRVDFEDNANEAFGDKSIHKKSAEEIINDFNLVY